MNFDPSRLNAVTLPLGLASRRSFRSRLVALLTLFAFAWLMLVGATHFHEQQAADDDCPVCSAVLHQTASSPVPPALPLATFVLLYPLDVPAGCPADYVSHSVTPPICGPPTA